MKVKSLQPTLSLRPTQFAVGLLEVEYKVLELKKLAPPRLQRLLAATPIPVIVTPWRDLCVIDHHHFLFACWHAGVTAVRVKVAEDHSDAELTYREFWRMMVRQRCAYLYDQFGDGPRLPLYLPLDIRGMADDPYRSLAWMVRKEGGYENSAESFAEFQWANFFRSHKLLIQRGREGFHEAVQRGLHLARSSEARHLPGYMPDHAAVALDEESLLVKSKYVPKARAKGALASIPDIRE